MSTCYTSLYYNSLMYGSRRLPKVHKPGTLFRPIVGCPSQDKSNGILC